MNYYTIGVRFKGSTKAYTYKVPIDIDLQVHEACLVQTSIGLAIVRVQEVHDIPMDTMEGIDYAYIAYTLLPIKPPVEQTNKSEVKRL